MSLIPPSPAQEAHPVSTGDLLGDWLRRTAGSPLTGRTWMLADPLDRGSRFIEGPPGPACTVIGEPRAGGQAAVARGALAGYQEPVALRVMLASTDPKAQQRERLQVAIGQLSRSHQQLLPALVRTVDSFLMSVPAAAFYHPSRTSQPGSATVEVWGHVLQWCPRTLADEIADQQGRGLGAESVVRRILPVMRTLHGMHGLGYIHRDLDPSNILVAEDGSLRIADFGIAVHMNANHTHTMTEAWGKQGRMPPEALTGARIPVGPSYDAWQIGFIIAEAATGGRPVLPGGGLSPRLNDLPKPVRAVVRGLLEPERPRRLEIPVAIERLNEWLDAARWLGAMDETRLASPVPPPLPAPARSSRRRRTLVGAALAAVIAGGGGIGYVAWNSDSGDRPAASSLTVKPGATPAASPSSAPSASVQPSPANPATKVPAAVEAATASKLADFRFQGWTVRAGSFSGDGTLLAASYQSPGAGVQIWNVTNPAAPQRISAITDESEAGLGSGGDYIDGAELSPDGHDLAVCAGSAITVWDVTDPAHPRRRFAIPRKPSAYTGCGATFSPSGTVLATTVGGSHRFYLWDIAGGRPVPLATLTTPGTYVGDTHFSPDGRSLIGVGYSDTTLWDISDPRKPKLRTTFPATALADFVSDDEVATVSFPVDEAPGGRLAIHTVDGAIRQTWESKQSFHFLGFTVDRKNQRVFVRTDGESGTPATWIWNVGDVNAPTHQVLQMPGIDPRNIISPDGTTLVIGLIDGPGQIWRVTA